MVEKIKVGIIGCGHQARVAHAPNYLRNPKSELVALCDVSRDALSQSQADFKVQYLFTDYHEMLERGIVDAVSVCVPTKFHEEVAVEAARHGIHVLCEKPIAKTLEEADRMIKAASKHRVKLMIGYNRRFLPNHIKTREFVQNGKIGKPIIGRAAMITFGPYSPDIAENLHPQEAKKRIGCLFDSGTHLIDLLMWIFGKPIGAYGFFSSTRGNMSVDESAVMMLKFDNNVLGSVCVAWADLPDFKVLEKSRKMEILGTKGKIESDGIGPSLSLYCTGSLSSKLRGQIRITPRGLNPDLPYEALARSYEDEIDSFLSSVVHDKKPPITGIQAKEVLRVVLAAYASSVTSGSDVDG